MDQDNEKDYLGRQYAPSSRDPEWPGTDGPEAERTDATGSGTGGAGLTGGTRTGSPDTGPAAGTGPDPRGPVADDTEVRPSGVRKIRVGTVVWGLVLTVLAVLLLLVNTVNLSVDPVLLVLGLTLGAGLALLAGGFLAAAAGRGRSR